MLGYIRRRRHAALRGDERARRRADRRPPERRLRRRGVDAARAARRAARGAARCTSRAARPRPRFASRDAWRPRTRTARRASHGTGTERDAAVAARRAARARWPRRPRAAQSDRHEFYFDASAGYVSARRTSARGPTAASASCATATTASTAFRLFGEYHGRITPTLRARVVADYRRRRVGRLRPHRGRHRLAADSAVAQSAAGALRRVLPAVLARERRPRLAEPVHVLVLGHQHVARRGGPADRRRMVAASAARRLPQRARAARVRLGLLRQRSRRHAALLARLVVARPADATQRRARDSAAAVHDAPAEPVAVHGDRPPARRLRGPRVALRAARARAARALRQPRRSVFVLRRPMGLGHRLQSPRGAGQLARRARARSSNGWTAPRSG